MAVDHLLTSFILLLISNTGFSAEISVFVQTGDSVQLDIQTQELPEFNLLFWTNDKSQNIVMYIHGAKVRHHSSYKDRVDFNDETFSLTLKNMQKTDSGLYTARTSGVSEKNIVTYRVSVIDAVEAPVLIVNSIWSSDSCLISYICRSHEFTLSSTFKYGSCSPEEVTSHDNYTLILYCSEESIICNHSNAVSWKEDRINIKRLCEDNERISIETHHGLSMFGLMFIVFGVVGILVFGGLLLYCCCKNNKGVKQSDDSDYDDVENTASAILMFVTMAVDHLLTSFILLLISNTGFSAEISVFVQTGDSVQLDIQTQELPEFDELSWRNDKSENIVKYINGTKTVKPHSSYKDRVYFNDETFSLTLKNMQKTDSGLYTARISGESEKIFATYRVSVIDAVKTPVLTVNSIWSSSDSCTVNFTCRAHDLMIHSSYQNNRCSPEEVTSHEIYTLILYCSEESIICNHSNPVSSKKDRIEIKQICEGFSAEISVFVQTGDSVQLDIQTQELPEFDFLSWTNYKSEVIVRYLHASKAVRLHSSYKDRVDFNTETFSLTLKNMQKTDSGLYTAKAIGESEKNIVTYRVSVIDAVEDPVLTVNSIWSSSDSCTVNFTCRAHDLMIHSSYQNNRCSPEEVTSHQIYTLILNCSEESIMCNHSNTTLTQKMTGDTWATTIYR
ncbi:CD48 antigen [Anabarilius grahami]|uniref:CD48 antigen n=1 Tax=Anabarilius grahami TaxID=495550 RepID=A0A3N0YCQ8_ANAGA|nr:CD48 antigen [Anabarilius grahami]